MMICAPSTTTQHSTVTAMTHQRNSAAKRANHVQEAVGRYRGTTSAFNHLAQHEQAPKKGPRNTDALGSQPGDRQTATPPVAPSCPTSRTDSLSATCPDHETKEGNKLRHCRLGASNAI